MTLAASATATVIFLLLGQAWSFAPPPSSLHPSSETGYADHGCSMQLGAALSRRSWIAIGAGYLTASPLAARVRASEITTQSQPLADLPMIRLKLPNGGFGREYVAIKLKVQGKGPFDFMLDTGLTTEFITPHLQQILGVKKGRSRISGLAAGGASQESDLIELLGAALCCGEIQGGSELPLPPLHAVITDFPQEHIDPAHDPVEGMLGMELLSMFDVDFDFQKGRIRLWKPGTAAKAIAADPKNNMVEIPAVVINETGLIGIRVSAPGVSPQPILGFLDCGATFSCVNWNAARFLGLPEKGDQLYSKEPAIAALGIDGRPLQLPTIKKQLSFAGDIKKDPKTGRPVGFEAPPSSWQPWDEVQLAIGDIPAFESILGDGKTPYKGPAALIGLDILAQRRVILEAGAGNTRQRRVFVSAK